MIPRILEYEDRMVKVTPEAFAIPEIKDILDKYKHPEPYLSYVHAMSAPDSPYVNIPRDQKMESVIFDIQLTFSRYEFDPEEPLLKKAIDKFKILYTSPMIAMADELGEELHRFRIWLRDNELDTENIGYRQSILKDIDKYATSYMKVRKQADEELKVTTKGGHEIGDY